MTGAPNSANYLVLCPPGFIYVVYRLADGTQRKIQVSRNSIEFGIALCRSQSILKQWYTKRRIEEKKLLLYLFTYSFIYLFIYLQQQQQQR